MPITVPLRQIPNQSLTITLSGNIFDISIRACNGIMAVSLACNGVDIIDNVVAAAGSPIIPAPYQENGNFMFLTSNNQLPNYERFTISQTLVYFTAAELALFRSPAIAPSARVPTVTATFFNPIAQLPLRFSPVGYKSA
jgi:hypothetical protein